MKKLYCEICGRPIKVKGKPCDECLKFIRKKDLFNPYEFYATDQHIEEQTIKHFEGW